MRLMRSLLVLLALSGVARAQAPLAADQIKMTPRASSSCGTGLSCVYWSSADNLLHQRLADGTDAAVGSGGGGGGCSATLTATAPITCNGSTSCNACSNHTVALTGVVPVNKGGTNATAGGSLGSVACWGSGNAYAFTAAPSSTHDILHGNPSGTGIATFGPVALGAEVSGQLPVANGGTGSATRNYVMLTGDESVAGVKSFTSGVKFDAATVITSGVGMGFTDNAADTGDYNTTPPHFKFHMGRPLENTGTSFCIAAIPLGGSEEKCLISFDHTTASSILELNATDFSGTPSIQYGNSIQSFYQGGSSMLQFNNSRKIVPDWNGDDVTAASPYWWQGHHGGTRLGTHAIAGEVDDRLWASVAAFIHDTHVPAITCSGDVTFNPVRQGSAATCTSSGNVTSFTIALPDDGSGRVIDGFQVAFRLKQGNAGHTWSSTITNAVLPAGVTSMKPSRTLNGVDYLLCTYFAAASTYQCNVASDAQIWQPYGNLLTKALGTSISGAGSGQDGYCVRWNNSALEYQLSSCPGAGGGASITLTAPTEISVSGSPGDTIALGWASASGRKFIASPADGTSGAYAGRAIVAADIPDLSGTYQPTDADLTAVAALASTAGMLSRTGAGAFAARTLACSNATCSWTNGDGSAGAPTLALNVGTGANTLCAGNDTRLPPSPGSAGCVLQSNGSAYVCTGPGTSGYVWTSNGAGLASWQASGGGPPTGSASGDLGGSYPGPSVVKVQGTPWTSTAPNIGDVACVVDIGGGVKEWQGCAQNIASPGAAGGFLYSDGAAWARHNACATGEFFRGAGAASPTCSALVSGDIPDVSATYQPRDADLDAVAALSSSAGMMSRTGAGTFTVRTMACGSSTCTWSNGDGAAGPPTVTIAATTINGAICTPGSSCTARTFNNAGRARINNSADTFYSEMVSAATANQVWTLPDATDTACGVAATQTLTNKTLTNPTVNAGGGVVVLPAATSPAQTAEGSVVWDSDDDLLTVGTGAARKTMCDLDSTQTLAAKTLTTPTIASFTNATHNHTNAAGGGQLNAGSCFSAGQVPVASGGTNATAVGSAGSIPYSASGTSYGFSNAYTAGGLWVSGGAGAPTAVDDVATGQVLVSGGVATNPAYSATPTVTTITGSTSVLTALLDAASAGALNIGTTTATSIALKQNTTLPTGKTLVVGSNTLIGAVADKLNGLMVAFTSQAVGDILQADSSSTMARLGAGAAGSFLRSAGAATLLAWSTLILPNSATAGDMPYASSTNTYGNLALGTAGRVLTVNPGATAPSWGHIVELYKACTSTTTGGAATNCAFDTLPAGLGSSNAKSFRGTITCRLTGNGAGGGTVALTAGTGGSGSTDCLLSQTLTAGTTPAGTPYGDKSDGSELGTKADATRGYNLYLDGGSTVTVTLAAPSGTVSGAVTVQCFLTGVTM